jgi:hypothetical protein
MPNFSFLVVSNTNLGLNPTDFYLRTVTISGLETMTITDDDLNFQDESGSLPVDTSQQVLANNIGTVSAGQFAEAVFANYIQNTTTGEYGYAYLIRIYTGTDPNNHGIQDGTYYWAFTIRVSNGDQVTQQGNNAGFVPYADLVACFTSGTLIKTQSGEVAIEDLTKGDMVLTMDHGYQPIRWIGSSKCAATGDLAPILIRKGALGNTRDLRVSPQHRMLLSGWHAEVLFGEREVLATAKSLVNDHSILREEGGEVEYFHMLFDSHEIVYAEGAPSESFHPGAEGWKALDMATRNEILELFPQLANGNFDSYGPSARASLKYKEGSLLSHSMISQTQH